MTGHVVLIYRTISFCNNAKYKYYKLIKVITFAVFPGIVDDEA
jgi:hypothetical protein